MVKQNVEWKKLIEHEIKLKKNAEHSLEKMRHFLFDYFYLLGPDPRKNMSIVVDTLGKVLGSTVALYNRLESGILKTWCIDNEPDGYQHEDNPDGHICYEMTIRQRSKTNMTSVVLDDIEGSEWEQLDANVAKYGLKSYLGFPVLVEEEVVGSLCVVDTNKREFSEMEIYIVEAFASAIRLEEERLLTQTRLTAAYRDLKQKNREIEKLALTDQLTNLPNRRAMIDNLNKTISILNRNLFQPEPHDFTGFSLILCDIDHFKRVNDTYGHNCGDYVLTIIAETLAYELRAKDNISRWGGEEFLILLPETGPEGAANTAERLRKNVSDLDIVYEEEHLQITMTFGVTTCDTEDVKIDAAINAADMALYDGKENGRNQVVIVNFEETQTSI